MIRINLLPVREITAEFGRRQELALATVVLGLTVVVLAGGYWLQVVRIAGLTAELASLRKEVEALNAKAKGVQDVERRIAELKSKLKIIDDLNKNKTAAVRVMESLSSATPARLWLTHFREAGGVVTIDGLAVDNQTIAEFLRALSGSAYFDDVELIETAQSGQAGVPLKRFSLRSKIIYRLPETDGKKKGAKN